VIGFSQFDGHFKQAERDHAESAGEFRIEQERADKASGKTPGVKESMGRVARGATTGLSPLVTSTFLLLFKVFGSAVLGLIGGSIFGLAIGVTRRSKTTAQTGSSSDPAPGDGGRT
jgi:hypothetical protein